MGWSIVTDEVFKRLQEALLTNLKMKKKKKMERPPQKLGLVSAGFYSEESLEMKKKLSRRPTLPCLSCFLSTFINRDASFSSYISSTYGLSFFSLRYDLPVSPSTVYSISINSINIINRCGERGANKDWSIGFPDEAAHVTLTSLSTGTVPVDSRG